MWDLVRGRVSLEIWAPHIRGGGGYRYYTGIACSSYFSSKGSVVAVGYFYPHFTRLLHTNITAEQIRRHL